LSSNGSTRTVARRVAPNGEIVLGYQFDHERSSNVTHASTQSSRAELAGGSHGFRDIRCDEASDVVLDRVAQREPLKPLAERDA
jgi:hypothetical protein